MIGSSFEQPEDGLDEVRRVEDSQKNRAKIEHGIVQF